MPSQATAVEQKRIIEDLLTSGVQAIAISPIDADNQIEWMNEIASKVPLITHDSDSPKSNRLFYIGMDNYAAGRACGELVKKALPEEAMSCYSSGDWSRTIASIVDRG